MSLQRRNLIRNGVATLNAPEIGQRGPFSGKINFESPAEPTAARITVAIISPRDGHTEHLASTPITLLPAGAVSSVQTADSHPEAITIHTPTHLETISGGTVPITGFAAPTFEQNLTIEILDGEGEVVSNSFATIASSMGEWGPFAADVAYTVPAETIGSICVQDISPADGGLLHRNCVVVTLEP